MTKSIDQLSREAAEKWYVEGNGSGGAKLCDSKHRVIATNWIWHLEPIAVAHNAQIAAALREHAEQQEKELADLRRLRTETLERYLTNEQKAMRTQLEQSAKDTARLDWVESKGQKSNGMLLEVSCDKFTKKWGFGLDDPQSATLREAIDTAIAQETKSPCPTNS